MPWYQLTFYGRTIGAIGITHLVSLTVQADSEERARKAAYDTHEHISGGLDGIKVREDWICPDGPACKSLTCQNNRVANGFEVWK